MLFSSLMLASLLQQSGGALAPLRDLGPATIEVRCVDLEGETIHGVEWRYAFEDAHGGPIEDPQAPGGRRQGMRFDSAPRPYQVDRALREREWSSSVDGLRIELQEERGLLVEARRDEAWGYLWLPRDWRTTAGRAHREGNPLTLELAPDWDLRVRVEDAAGQPTTGAHVGLLCEELRFDQSLRSSREEYVFGHVGYEARRARVPILVRLHELIDPPVETRIDSRRAPAEPVVLRLPPTGAVEVRVRRQEERRHLQLTVSLSVAGKTGIQGQANPRQDVVCFEHVGLGLRLAARVQAGEADTRTELDGPRWAGDVVTLELNEPRAPEPDTSFPALAGATDPSPEATGAGFLLLDPGIPLDQIDVRVRDPLGRRGDHGALLRSDGQFEFSLPAGRARFEVRAKGLLAVPEGEVQPAFRLDVELVPGENELAALSAIDLRGKFFAHTVRLVGLPDPRATSARVLFGPRTWPRSQRAYTWLTQTPLTVVSLWPRIDLELYVPGFRAIELFDLEREREVTLEPGLPVELRLVTPAALPDAPYELAAVLQPPERLMRVTNWSAPAFDTRRTLTTTAFVPGANQVVWLLRHGSHGSAFVTTRPQFVTVLDSPSPQVFTLELPPEDLARWLAEAR